MWGLMLLCIQHCPHPIVVLERQLQRPLMSYTCAAKVILHESHIAATWLHMPLCIQHRPHPMVVLERQLQRPLHVIHLRSQSIFA